MNISITFRHMASSEAIKTYTSDKLGKLQRFLRQPMTAKVTLSIDGVAKIAEARISSGGEHLEAKETGEDMYALIDHIMSKLERQIRGVKGADLAKRKGAESVRSERLPRAVASIVKGAKKKAASKTAAKTARKTAKKKTR